MKNVQTQITYDQIKSEAQRFLRGKFLFVGGINITSLSENLPNPRENMWEVWGPKMLRVWGEANVSTRRKVPYKTISFELEVFISRDGNSLSHAGVVTGNAGRQVAYSTSGPQASPHRQPSKEELAEIVTKWLKKEFRSIQDLVITGFKETSIDAHAGYEVHGRALTAMSNATNSVNLRRRIFKCRVIVTKEGRLIQTKGRVWNE